MNWIVIIIGLSTQPTFHGYAHWSDCAARTQHINRIYGGMVQARCIPVAQARKLGYKGEGK